MTAPQQPWLRQRCDERIGVFSVRHDLVLTMGWTVVFGSSGTGKSTWLRMLAGLVPQRTGSLLLNGINIRHIPTHLRRIGLVEQSPALFPHLNVQRNVSFGCKAEGRDVDELLEAFQLTPLRHADVRSLSGGERQRVAIARALASSPQVLLLDEVFTGMDAALRENLIQVLREYSQRKRLPIVSVTHDVAEVFATAEEVLRMQDGNIVAQGSPAQVLQEERANLSRKLAT